MMTTKQDEPNFIASLDVKHVEVPDPIAKGRKKRVEHFVYASSLYGSTFGIFCTITGRKVPGNLFRVKSILLKIINYVGPINIGFVDDPNDEYHYFEPDECAVFFGVEGAKLRQKIRIKIEPPLEISKDVPITITFNRMLHPLKEFKELNAKCKDRTVKSNEPVPASPLFDTEFNYRNGVDLYFHLLRPGMLGYDPNNKLTMPSLRCHTSNIRMVF